MAFTVMFIYTKLVIHTTNLLLNPFKLYTGSKEFSRMDGRLTQ